MIKRCGMPADRVSVAGLGRIYPDAERSFRAGIAGASQGLITPRVPSSTLGPANPSTPLRVVSLVGPSPGTVTRLPQRDGAQTPSGETR